MSEQAQVSEYTLAELRRATTEAATRHRELEADLRVEKARAEFRAMGLPSYGAMKNEPERARFLVVALDDDEGYCAIADAEYEARSELEALRAEIEIHDDAIRDRQMSQRDRESGVRYRELAQKEAELAFEVRQFDHHLDQETGLKDVLSKIRESVATDGFSDFDAKKAGRA